MNRIDDLLLDEVSHQAQSSPRLRMKHILFCGESCGSGFTMIISGFWKKSCWIRKTVVTVLISL